MATANIRPTAYRYLVPNAEPDSFGIITASQKISRCIRFPDFFNVVLECALGCSGAQKGIFFSLDEGEPMIRSRAKREQEDKLYIQALPKSLLSALEQDDIPTAIIQQVIETGKGIIINKPNALSSNSKNGANCPPLRLLVFPIVYETETNGIIYLESDRQQPFSEDIISMISVICKQAAISFQNVLHFDMLGEKVVKQMLKVSQLKKELETAKGSKTDYLTSINGAIRSKLGDVIGFSKLIQRREISKPLSKETHHHLEHIQKSTHELSEYLKNAFTVSNPFTAEKPDLSECLDLRLLIKSIYQSNRETAAKKSVLFDLNFKEPLPKMIYSDRGEINRILVTIISRTIQLSHQDDTVDLTVSAKARDLRIVITRKQFRLKSTHVSSQIATDVLSNGIFKNGDSLPLEMGAAQPSQAFFDFIDLDMIKKAVDLLEGRLSTTAKPYHSSLTIYIPLYETIPGKPRLDQQSNQTGKVHRKMPQLIAQELLLDFKMMQSTPIYKGGTLCRIIRKAKRTCEDYNSIYPAILEKIEAAVFEGDKLALDQLITKLLTMHHLASQRIS